MDPSAFAEHKQKQWHRTRFQIHSFVLFQKQQIAVEQRQYLIFFFLCGGSPVATMGFLLGLAPQTKLQALQIEIWNTVN